MNHNSIIRATVTDGFLRYFQENLVPLLEERYGDALCAIEMYESHLEKQLAIGGEWYYPLSLLTDSGALVQWVAWEFPKNGSFYEMNPYAYASAAPLAFRLVDDPPAQCRDAVSTEAQLSNADALPISVGVVAGDIRMLIGKYSQSFVDALTGAITREIERVHGVEGLSESGIRLEMLFAPNTYMEHTCEGVTYRRLSISEEGARVSKDFWVRWQRASGNEPVTVGDEIRAGEVVFSIGEDVSQKIREKEYRYLLRQNAEKYRGAMGRKTVTEWRELLKKAIKRGTLSRVSIPEAPAVPETRETTVADAQSSLPVVDTQVTVTDSSAVAVETPLFTEGIPEVYTPEIEIEAPSDLAPVDDLSVAETPDALANESTEEDPWLARLKEYAGQENTAVQEQASELDENTEEFRDAMMRMRSILGISEEENTEEKVPSLAADESEEVTACEQILDGSETDDVLLPFEMEEQRSIDATEAEEFVTEPDQALESAVAEEEIVLPESADELDLAPVEEAEDKEISSLTEPESDELPESQRPLFVKPVQENFFDDLPEEPAPVAPTRENNEKTERNEAELHRQIRDGVLRELEARERERLAEEARRAVIEKEEREAQMARIAQERMEAEASRRELEELRAQTRALSEELRAYTQMCMDIMSAPSTAEQIQPAAPEQPKTVSFVKSDPEPVHEPEIEPVQQEIQFTITKPQGAVAEDDEPCEKTEVVEAPTQEKQYVFTEEQLAALLREHTEKLEQAFLEQARKAAREELEAERAALASANAVESVASESALQSSPSAESVTLSENESGDNEPQAVQADDVASVEKCEKTEHESVAEVVEGEASHSEIAELLQRNRREQEEEERRLALEALIREQEEKLSAMRREEEERRIRAEQLIAEQVRLEELARVERERAEAENHRLEEERRRAEELALVSYEKHLVEAKRLEEELEAARRRREEEDLRIAEAERKIAEQTMLAEQAREQQRLKNEEARRFTAQTEQRLSELDAAREYNRELAERTEQESLRMQQSLQEQEEALRAEAIRREQEESQRIAAEQLARQRLETPGMQMQFDAPKDYNYVSRVVHLYFTRAIDPNVIGQIHRLMSDTIAYFNKTHVSISVRAEIVGPMQLDLNFIRIPKEEEPLLINIVKVLGRSNIGIRRASIDD